MALILHRIRWLAAIFVCVFPFFLLPAKAFDTGHHFDLTRTVLKKQGMGPDAINSIILANWLTDYFSTAPVARNVFLRPALNRLHFDNLNNQTEVENYYGWLMHNLRELVQEAAQENDRIKMLVVMGIAHHVIQDFYSHSNWTELYPRQTNGSFDIDLFPRMTSRLKGDLRTGSWPEQGQFGHGSYNSGLNKDSHVRPGWDNAYVMAFAATRRLTLQMQAWAEEVRPGFSSHVSSINLTTKNRRELLRDLKSAHDISMWVKAKVLGLPASDGHWKGNLSGNGAKFTAANHAFITWKNSFLTGYFKQTDLAARMALNLEKPNPPRVEKNVSLEDFEGQAIIVNIHSFEQLQQSGTFSEIGAEITINGEIYLGRIFSNRKGYSSETIPAWQEIHLEDEDTDSIDIQLALYAYDNSNGAKRVLIDANEKPDVKVVSISLTEKTNLLELLKERVLQPEREILRSSGEGTNPVSITYSIEVVHFE